MRERSQTLNRRVAALPPVRITLPRALLASFITFCRLQGSAVAVFEGVDDQVVVTARPQLRLALLAAWAELYRHRIVSTGGRGLALVPGLARPVVAPGDVREVTA
jgi:hypothetical protein